MAHENQHIEDIFKTAFENHEVQPPLNIWDSVESSLNESKNVEAVYASTFKNARIAPSASVWKRISHTLFWRNFLSFKAQSFNVYYLGAALSVCGVTMYSLFPPQKIQKTDFATIANIIEKSVNVEEIEEQGVHLYENNNTKAQATNLYQQKEQSQQNKGIITPQKLHHSEQAARNAATNATFSPAKTETAQAVFNFTNVRIVGEANICANSPVKYSIEGLPENAIVDWKLPQGASSKFISTRKISALFSKEGSFMLAANVQVGKTSSKIELPVRVEEAHKPEIKGRLTVCEGSEQELYSVNEAVNKEISYSWELQRNTIIPSGNKYINVNWNTAGKDTLTVTRVNLTTGCASSNSAVVVVEARPKVDFQMTAINTNEYEFWFVGESKKIQTFSWFIDGSKYSGESLVHTNYGAQTSLVKLEVSNKAGCKNSIQKEVAFGRNVLFVPQTFDLSANKGFIPQTNTRLKSYTIEIYNSRSEKIWESNELTDGKPAKAWNGMYRNAPVGKGKYMWRISATFDDGTQWHGIRQKDGKVQPTGIFVVER